MKKLFTLIAALFTVFTVNAETTTLYEDATGVTVEWGSAAISFEAATAANWGAGDLIHVTVSASDASIDPYPQVSLKSNAEGWGDIASGILVEKLEKPAVVTFALTEDQITEMKTSGFHISGCAATVVKVVYETKPAPVAKESLWKGSLGPADWNGTIKVDLATVLSKLAPGKVLRLDYTAEGADYYQAQVMGGWWTILPSTFAMAGEEVGAKNAIIDCSGADHIDITLAQEDIDLLTQQGSLLICGNGIVLTEIELLDPTAGINTVKTDKAVKNAPLYNMAGQQVEKQYKGIIIQNGKKFVNK